MHRLLVVLLATLPWLGCSGGSDSLDAARDGRVGDARVVAFVDIDVLAQTSCARRSDGTAACWGQYFTEPMIFEPAVDAVVAAWGGAYLLRDHEIDVIHCPECGPVLERAPPPGRYLAVSASSAVCAISEEHDVRCWGLDTEPRPPPTDEPLVSVATGWWWACAQTESGRFVCWNPYAEEAPPPLPERDFVQVLPGDRYVCGLGVGGEVECWTDVDTVRDQLGEAPPGPFTQIAVGGYTACGLRPDGTIDCWGLYPIRRPRTAWAAVPADRRGERTRLRDQARG